MPVSHSSAPDYLTTPAWTEIQSRRWNPRPGLAGGETQTRRWSRLSLITLPYLPTPAENTRLKTTTKSIPMMVRLDVFLLVRAWKTTEPWVPAGLSEDRGWCRGSGVRTLTCRMQEFNKDLRFKQSRRQTDIFDGVFSGLLSLMDLETSAMKTYNKARRDQLDRVCCVIVVTFTSRI